MATPGQQAAQAMQSGGVTAFADNQPRQDDGVQLAGLLTKLVQKSAKAAPGRVGKEVAPGVAGRMPEPGAEQIMPEGTTAQATQDKLAADSLSLEGKQRFDAAGGDAATAIQLPSDPAGMDAALPTPADQAQSVTATAQQGVRGTGTGVADEGDALDLIEMTDPQRLLVDTDQGLDFNFDNMESGDDVNAAINAVSEIYKNPIEAEKRGVRTNEQTLAAAGDLLADELGLTKKLLRKKSGQLLNAEEMVAVRALLQKSASRLETLARQIQAGDAGPETMIKFRRQMAIHAGVQMKAKGAQTEIARALQAFKIPTGADIPVDAMNAVLNESGGAGLATDMARGYLDALQEGGQANANRYVAGAWYQKVSDVWMEVYINGLLSYFPTHLKNAISTPMFMTYNVFADTVGATYGGISRTGQRMLGRNVNPEGIYLEDVFARLYGYSKSFRDAWSVAHKTFKDEMPADQLNKVEAGTLRAIDSESLNVSGTAGQIVDHLGRLIRIPGRGLMAADDFWRVVSSRGELYEQAVRQGRASKAAGKSEQDALDDAVMVLLDPKFKAADMDAASRYATLTDDLGNGMLGSFTTNFRRNWVGKLLMPFAKAPTNGMRRVGEGHPLIVGASMLNPDSTIRKNLLGQNGARAQQRALGRLSMGAGTMSVFYNMAVDGDITGSYPRDPQLQKMWNLRKIQPYSLVFIGDEDDRAERGLAPWPTDDDGDPLPKYNRETGLPNGELIYVSYQGLEPVSALLGIAASTARHQTFFYDPEDRLDLFTASTVATAEYFRDLPMLKGIGDIVRAFDYQDINILTDGVFGGTIGALPTPYSSAIRGVERMTDSDKRIRKVNKALDYYTLEDVERMYEESQSTNNPYPRIPYGLVGTVKKLDTTTGAQFFYDQVAYGWETQLMNLPYVQDKLDNYSYQFDVLGNPRTSGTSFEVNPSEAIWNSITPFKTSYGAKLEPWQEELYRLGVPLRESRDVKRYKGIPLDAKNRGKLMDYAKNKVSLDLNGAYYTFRDYIQVMMSTMSFANGDDDERTNDIKNAEDRFLEAGFAMLLADDENLARVFYEKQALRELGVR